MKTLRTLSNTLLGAVHLGLLLLLWVAAIAYCLGAALAFIHLLFVHLFA